MTEADALLKLQTIDIELMKVTRLLTSLPQRKKIEAIHKAQKKVTTELNKALGRRKDIEMEIQVNKEEYARVSDTVTEVQAKAVECAAYRAVQDFELQLSSLAKRLEKLTFDNAALAEKLEQAFAAEKRVQALAARLNTEEEDQRKSLKEDASDIQKKYKRLREERSDLLDEISSELCDRYERASQRFGGIAVEKLVGDKPSACRVALQARAYAELKHADAITECPYCHRILIVDHTSCKE